MDYYGIIGDIKDSRIEADRGGLQKALSNVLNKINEEKRGHLASPYTITLGDEFQALYKNPTGLFTDLWRILASLKPAHARFSIGFGKLATAVNKEKALGMDGPVFHVARDGIEEAKKSGATFIVGGTISNLKLINNSLMLISHVIENWKPNRYRVQAKLSEGIPVKDIAASIGISESAVYKNMDSAALNTINQIGKDIEQIFKGINPQAQ